jgi:alanine racemase
MGRIGYLPGEYALEEIIRISKLKNIYLEGVFSHFATADEEDKQFSYSQFERFNSFLERLSGKGVNFDIRHISNSAAIMDMPETYYDGVRPGIVLYGYYPSNEVHKEKLALKPVMTLKAHIIHIKDVMSETPISYGRKYYTEKPSRIATLPFGYADGYTRLLFGKAHVIAEDRLVPVVGRICMDQCMIDITECSGIGIGDEVIVMGERNGIKNNADDIAKLLGTINYEVLCMVSKRVPRVYIENGKIVKVKNYV